MYCTYVNRLTHFGVCDKIPHFKYGIYSLQWKQERDKTKLQCKRKNAQSLKSPSENTTHRTNLKSLIAIEHGSKSPSDDAICPDSIRTIRTQGDRLNSIKLKQANVSYQSGKYSNFCNMSKPGTATSMVEKNSIQNPFADSVRKQYFKTTPSIKTKNVN